MKLIFTILTLTILASNAIGQDNSTLYPISQGNLWGYIDNTGKTVIKPQYFSAGLFSEGLAPVRLKGTYGYIDKAGTFIISSKYDFALPFNDGQAKVFIDGKPFFIDNKGNITFHHNFKSISSFETHSFAIAITQTDKYCLIDRKGKLLTDTIYMKINPFTDGVAVVYGLNHLPFPEGSQIKKFETGVIDTSGKWMIKFGNYKDIGRFYNGYAPVERFNQTEEERRWSRGDAIIDKNGKLKFILPAGKYFLGANITDFHDDLSVVHFYPERYMGVINTDGDVLFSDPNWKKITPFRFNRAFVQDSSGKWHLINSKGKQVSDLTFENILYQTFWGNSDDLFTNGKAWVKLSSGWVTIDTTGRVLSEPKVFSGIHDERLRRVGDIFFFEEDISIESDRYDFRYGFWNSRTNSTVSPTYHDIDMYGFNNDLIYAMKDEVIYYINSKGEVIWQDTSSQTFTLTNLNIDFMNRGYFYAYSEPHKEDIGGFGGSDNSPGKISKSDNFPPKTLSVVVHPELKDTIYSSNNAMTVYIGNSTSSEINFNAQDSRLYMKVQALNSKGEWKDIEYLPNSWCGNSYHTLTLEPKHYWSFLTPVYEGEFNTKFRIELKYIDPSDRSKYRRDQKIITVYSNEYEGGINPGQFWNKREYFPRGLMDPYND